MKKSTLLITSIAFALILSACQSSTTANKDAASKEPSSSSISTQTKTNNKEEVSEQTTTARKDKTSEQTEDSSKDELANTTDKNVNYEEIYNKFLSGQIDVISKNGGCINRDYYSGPNSPVSGAQKYAIYDMNGDDIPELIISSSIALDIFWIYNNELAHWHSNAQYAKPLNNMALLYERHGGAPTHTDYQYFVLGYQGEELYRITFGEYFCENTDGVIYDKKYYIDNIEVTKAIYDSLSERFLNISDDKIEWKPFPH